MPHPDSPDHNYTHEQRREYFLRTLAISLDRFNMDSVGELKDTGGDAVEYKKATRVGTEFYSTSGAAVAEALREYRALKADREATSADYMHPHADNFLWIYGENHGRYLTYLYEVKSSLHLAFAFKSPSCPAGPYSPEKRPILLETFQLKVTRSKTGYKFYDSRPRKKSFTAMRDGEIEFKRYVSKLMFGGDVQMADDYVEAIKHRLFVMS